jgi:ATP-dependent Clp protease ATP-binding subunit ClpA
MSMKIYDSKGNFERVMDSAKNFGKQYRHEYYLLEHFLLAIICEKKMNKILDDEGINIKGLVDDIDSYLLKQSSIVAPNTDYTIKPTICTDRICNRAFTQNYFHGGEGRISLLDLFLAITHEKQSHACYFLEKWGVDRKKISEAWEKVSKQTNKSGEKSGGGAGAIEEYCTNVTELADQGKIDPVIGRDDIIGTMTQVLARKNKCNVLLVGDPGTGKTAIAEGLALKIVKNEVPDFIKGSTIYSINVGQLLAGAKYRGEFEERLNDILKAASEIEKCILFIDEAHQIHGAGGGANSSVDMGNMIKPYLARGTIKVIAATTYEEYFKHFEKDRALMRRFNKVDVDEPSATVTKQILHELKPSYETFHNVLITDDAINAAVDLSIRYQSDKKLPDKAIDLIDASCAIVRAKDLDDNLISKVRIQEQLCRVIPGMTMENLTQTAEQADNFINAKDHVLAAVYNQDAAINAVFDQILLSRAGLNNPNKPIGSYLFRGPTGTGKCLAYDQEVTVKLPEELIKFGQANGFL